LIQCEGHCVGVVRRRQAVGVSLPQHPLVQELELVKLAKSVITHND
jgi:hypothetical protein